MSSSIGELGGKDLRRGLEQLFRALQQYFDPNAFNNPSQLILLAENAAEVCLLVTHSKEGVELYTNNTSLIGKFLQVAIALHWYS